MPSSVLEAALAWLAPPTGALPTWSSSARGSHRSRGRLSYVVVVVEDLWAAAHSISIRKRIICLLFKRSYDASTDPLWPLGYNGCECFPTIARNGIYVNSMGREKERELLFSSLIYRQSLIFWQCRLNYYRNYRSYLINFVWKNGNGWNVFGTESLYLIFKLSIFTILIKTLIRISLE